VSGKYIRTQQYDKESPGQAEFIALMIIPTHFESYIHGTFPGQVLLGAGQSCRLFFS
jgi:hypothetical protein